MSPREFLRIFPTATHDDLAAITGHDRNTVERWFMNEEQSSARRPSKRVLIILDLYTEVQRLRTAAAQHRTAQAEFYERQGFATRASQARPISR